MKKQIIIFILIIINLKTKIYSTGITRDNLETIKTFLLCNNRINDNKEKLNADVLDIIFGDNQANKYFDHLVKNNYVPDEKLQKISQYFYATYPWTWKTVYRNIVVRSVKNIYSFYSKEISKAKYYSTFTKVESFTLLNDTKLVESIFSFLPTNLSKTNYNIIQEVEKRENKKYIFFDSTGEYASYKSEDKSEIIIVNSFLKKIIKRISLEKEPIIYYIRKEPKRTPIVNEREKDYFKKNNHPILYICYEDKFFIINLKDVDSEQKINLNTLNHFDRDKSIDVEVTLPVIDIKTVSLGENAYFFRNNKLLTINNQEIIDLKEFQSQNYKIYFFEKGNRYKLKITNHYKKRGKRNIENKSESKKVLIYDFDKKELINLSDKIETEKIEFLKIINPQISILKYKNENLAYIYSSSEIKSIVDCDSILNASQKYICYTRGVNVYLFDLEKNKETFLFENQGNNLFATISKNQKYTAILQNNSNITIVDNCNGIIIKTIPCDKTSKIKFIAEDMAIITMLKINRRMSSKKLTSILTFLPFHCLYKDVETDQ